MLFLTRTAITITTLTFFIDITYASDYGVDVSFPIHHHSVSTNFAWLPHNTDPKANPTPNEYKNMTIQHFLERQLFYENFMKECRDYYGREGMVCESAERHRIEMNLRQPQSMVNYTDIGFKKIRAPKQLFKIIKDFWETNKNTLVKEAFPGGTSYVNHWKSPTWMVNIGDTSSLNNIGGGIKLKKKIWSASKKILEQWTGQELIESSVYGIRVYTNGAVLAPHVDRLPLVSSAIINVAQDADYDWPLEVYNRNGRAHNVTMGPGDMVLYEGHSLIHGRPFPLKGKYVANIFIHFEPVGRRSSTYHPFLRRRQRRRLSSVDTKKHDNDNGIVNRDGLPIYIINRSPEEIYWRKRHRKQWGSSSIGERIEQQKQALTHAKYQQPQLSTRSSSSSSSTTNEIAEVHLAAQRGDLKTLTKIASEDKEALNLKDHNGWQPIHEASRAGFTDVILLLIEHDVDINQRTNENKGGTALWWAEVEHGKYHPVVKLLRRFGGVSIGPEL